MRRMALQMRLGWVIVYVDEPPAAAEFYERAFGLRTEFVAPGGSYAQLDTGPTKLAFASYALGEKNFDGGVRRAGADGPPPNVEITLVHEDVDAAYAQALDAGCAPLAAPEGKPHGPRVGPGPGRPAARAPGEQAARPARRLRPRSVRHARRARDADVGARGVRHPSRS